MSNEAAARRAFEIISSEHDEESHDSSNEGQLLCSAKDTAPASIRLNPKAKKVEAHKNPKKNTVASEKKSRKWVEAAESVRKLAGAKPLQGLLKDLDRDQADLVETEKRRSGIIVRHADTDNKKSKLKISKNPVLIRDPFYLLPSKLLSACMQVLPISNQKTTAVSVDESQPSQSQDEEDMLAPQSHETGLLRR